MRYKVRFEVDGKSVTEDITVEGDADPRPEAVRILNLRSAGTGELLKWIGNHAGTLAVFHDGQLIERTPPA